MTTEEHTSAEAEPATPRSRITRVAGTDRSQGTTVGRPAAWGRRGSEADAAAERQQQEAARRRAEAARARRMPRRFDLAVNESADVIVLDVDFFQIKEHEKWDDGNRRYVFESCCGEWSHCVLCEDAKLGRGSKHGFRFSNTVDLISVIDLRSFRVTRGPEAGKVIAGSRKLVAIKPSDRPRWKEIQAENGGSMRGVHLLLERGAGDRESRIGTPEFIAKLSDEDIRADESLLELAEEYRDQDGTVVRRKGEIYEGFNFEELFPAPSTEDQLRRFGGSPPIGSRAANRRFSNDSEWGDRLDPGVADAVNEPEMDMGASEAPSSISENGAGRTRLRRRAPQPTQNDAGQDDGRFAPPGASYGDDDIPF